MVAEVSRLNTEEAKIQLYSLQQAFDAYNNESEKVTLNTEDGNINTLLEELETSSDIYTKTKAILVGPKQLTQQEVNQQIFTTGELFTSTRKVFTNKHINF